MSLYVVATPIGNMEDITLRALRILKEVDYILSEDTRVSKKLLDRYEIKKPLISFHHHSSEKRYNEVLKLLEEDKNIALISDAGTPAISDPGGVLLDLVRKKLPEVLIEPIPGPSALTAALSVSGLKIDKFLFFGFLPHKKGRSKMINEVISSKYPVVLFESKHRILKLLEELSSRIEKDSKKVMVFRELSKMYYTFYNDSAKNLLEKLSEDQVSLKGEFTVIIY
ncbi:16S rRNA (cytidine(1402)-2'-O)-methyltransferase [Candidatus Falkowbacteria bacterium HGW-Falkowbacteria-1]|jgi:16S rRNA (cytidine1402-2'-O)-methyltransferase|uniref:Ribosomal RNA small subunit methyltransferase I n=1 Tax=Candidatus Falkowbacteria bacterium HGW-Falkowbacteria-1 TaxID=2013768 RepID=A0A2N2E9H7_9BACT|nr:MAG: 16S rRNA (cytidine(1402)-2'-O)-methyltransferase [Candidatus Falkowbacteria bacterium HGW-Falkowbacteria-1]